MRKNWGLWLVLILSFWTFKPLLLPGWIPIHDNTQVVRVQQMAQALSDGQFPVRWVRDLGYGFGYPLFNFYAPLAYYVGALFNLLNFDSLIATKLMIILGILLAGTTMYFWAREIWGEAGGILSALFYLYAPYRAVDVYVRGAVAEFWAMAFLPLVFLSLEKLATNNVKVKKWWGIGVLAFAAVILSHNLTALMLLPFLFIMIFLITLKTKKKKRYLLSVSALVIASLGLSAFYWLPALTEMKLTRVFGQIGGGADWRDHFVFLDQLWASPWGFGGSAPGRADGMSFMIGKFHLVLAALSGLILFWSWKKKRSRFFWPLLTGWLFFLVAAFFTQRFSWPIWRLITPLNFIQYPWRFLIFATLATSFLAGSLTLCLKEGRGRLGLTGGVILLLLVFNTKYFQPQEILSVSASDLLAEENIKWTTSRISDEYLPIDFPVPQSKPAVVWEKVALVEGRAKIEDLIVESDQIRFRVEAAANAATQINLAYFPGWRVQVNDQSAEFEVRAGKIRLALPTGESRVRLFFENTSWRTLANWLSFLTALSWLGLMLKLDQFLKR